MLRFCIFFLNEYVLSIPINLVQQQKKSPMLTLSIQPLNDRQWQQNVEKLANVSVKGDFVTILNLIFKSNNEKYFILKINGFHSSKKLMLNLVEGFIIHRISVQPN
jgi:hypothetical protein